MIPETGLFYTNANEMAWVFSVVKRPPYTPVSSGKQLYRIIAQPVIRSDRTGMPEIPSLIGIEQRYSTRDIRRLSREGKDGCLRLRICPPVRSQRFPHTF